MHKLCINIALTFALLLGTNVCANIPDSLLKLANKSTDSLKVTYLIKSGDYYQNRNTEKSIEFFNRALKVAQKIKNKYLIANTLHLLGGIENGKGNYTKALHYFNQSLSLFETLNNKSGISKVNNSLGNTFMGQLNNDLGEKHYKLALKFANEAKDTGLIAVSSYGVANSLFSNKKYVESLVEFDFAAELFKKLNKKFGYASVRLTQTSIWLALNKISEAEKTVNEALPIMLKLNDNYGISQAYFQLAQLHEKKKDFAKAIAVLKDAIQLCREINARDNVKEFYKYIANNYKALGDLTNAYDYINRYAKLNDSIFTEKNAKETAAMQAKYESVKKEKELIKNQAQLKKERALSEQSRRQNKIYLIGLIGMFLLAILALRAYRKNKKASKEIALQKTIIETKNKDITDSIRYALQIQQSLLPLMNHVSEQVGDLFIYYEPKDIVSGDFYWTAKKGNKIYIAAADCTGHGVPGAFMSMLGFHALDNALKNSDATSPADLLQQLHNTIVDTFRKKDRSHSVNDGMDITLCSFDIHNKTIELAAANNRAYIVSNGELKDIKGDAFSIGNAAENRKFTNKTHQVSKGDILYLFSDGFASQFGGISGKKLKYSRMKEILLKYSGQSMSEQKACLNREMQHWKGSLEQIDDILVLGIRIS